MANLDLQVLLEQAKRCRSVGELRALMEANGVWLNDAAAASTFRAVEAARVQCLTDAQLMQVTGGVGTASDVADRSLLDFLERAVAGQAAPDRAGGTAV